MAGIRYYLFPLIMIQTEIKKYTLKVIRHALLLERSRVEQRTRSSKLRKHKTLMIQHISAIFFPPIYPSKVAVKNIFL